MSNKFNSIPKTEFYWVNGKYTSSLFILSLTCYDMIFIVFITQKRARDLHCFKLKRVEEIRAPGQIKVSRSFNPSGHRSRIGQIPKRTKVDKKAIRSLYFIGYMDIDWLMDLLCIENEREWKTR